MKSNFTLLLGIISFVFGCKGHLVDEDLTISDSIRINQIGFYPGEKKSAILINFEDINEFSLINAETKEIEFEGMIESSVYSTYSGKKTRLIDFTAFEKTGTFELYVNGVGKSPAFEIKKEVYRELGKASLKAFYYQRASSEIPAEYGGIWSRDAGHMDDQVFFHPSTGKQNHPDQGKINSSKGWYDAGDYNKYIVNSGITMGTLMSLYEDFPAYFKNLDMNIPESSNSVPDLLDEVKWNLDWMVTMQDPEDGGVFHKLTTAKFEGMVAPKDATSTRYLVSKSTAATLDFAAVMAQASRVFKEVNPELSVVYLKASEKAWNWALKNPEKIYNQTALNEEFDPDVVTGAYGDFSLEDEWIWAASELLITTQNQEYWKKLSSGDYSYELPSWSKVKWLGFYSILSHEDGLKQIPQEWISNLKISLIESANSLQKGKKNNGYQVAMGTDQKDFVWGSNAVAANQGILLIKAFLSSGNKSYLTLAEENLDYILGRNATGYSYVTGFGYKTPMHPHHRLAAYRPEMDPIPGFLVGGPNPGQQDQIDYPSAIADESFIDDTKSYASNEIAINWNAPFAYLVNAIEAIENKVK
ncbi:glycoside hydrolase family 9 protein [Algoriphagus aestuarii]|nr:glycoside hydrolase family 9 protein [Algoriphagus aestuarii]